MRKDLEWEYADREVSENEVEESGRQLGFHLPKDYIDCVKINGGASVLREEFNVGNVERCFGSLFSFDKKSSKYIVQKYELYKPMLPKKVFPIANDPAGNLICLDYKNNIDNPIVLFLWECFIKKMLERITICHSSKFGGFSFKYSNIVYVKVNIHVRFYNINF